MNKPQNIIPAAQDLAREWVTHAAEGTSSQADAVVRWALSRIDHADVPGVVYGVMLTLTGNKKSAKEAQRTAATAVKKATRALSRKSPQRRSRRGTWVIAVAGAILGVGAVLAWRMMVPPGEPEPKRQEPPAPPMPPVP
ncbi:hypothetical protein [Paenarthrobacter ilicis]|uniref:Uncharacterized protein n=1 Tax=Paenarthrobacter ilicis TaxID=43665 RepID=A0ABX0TNB1_9MICC|nr:hypothetical protein [Paenarthrobacter ilicis]MBM7794532.1 hypothetical protein [Paenarthrobacter ilicis]NIJ02356.1 hypothetical protein [Paenarthrobacter ilicis]